VRILLEATHYVAILHYNTPSTTERRKGGKVGLPYLTNQRVSSSSHLPGTDSRETPLPAFVNGILQFPRNSNSTELCSIFALCHFLSCTKILQGARMRRQRGRGGAHEYWKVRMNFHTTEKKGKAGWNGDGGLRMVMVSDGLESSVEIRILTPLRLMKCRTVGRWEAGD
jgi:hypothetical protein